MVRLVASLIGTYFVAFAATSLVVAGYDSPAPARLPVAEAAPKGDRLDTAGRKASPRRVSEVELIGVEDVLVILRDGQGREIYRVDHARNTTIAARDAIFPQLRLHVEAVEEQRREAPRSTPPVRRAPAGTPVSPGGDGADEEAGEEQIFACESGLSSLADRKAASLPRVCLSDATDAAGTNSVVQNL